MFSNSLRSISGIIACMIIFFFYLQGVSLAADLDLINESSRKLLKTLDTDENPATRKLLNQWAEYLQTATTYSNSDHIDSINALQEEYSHLTSLAEQCLTHKKAVKNNYNSEWLDQLLEHFSLASLKDKRRSVLLNLKSITGCSETDCYSQLQKEIYFKAAVLYASYHDYFYRFLDFYKNQSEDDKEILKTRKIAIERFLTLINERSFEKMFVVAKSAQKLSEIEARNYDEEIYNYFKAHPLDCDIDGFKALDDFQKRVINQGN